MSHRNPACCDSPYPIFFPLMAVVGTLSGILAMLRLISNISLFQPLHLNTSGGEEACLLSLWRFVHHQPVYVDPYKVPYVTSYFPWLFYGFYGVTIKAALSFTGLSDAWIPTFARITTFLFSIAGFGITWRSFIERFLPPSLKEKILLSLVSFYLFFGPLPAFWPITARPDMAALVFELGAFFYFAKYFETSISRAVFGAALLGFSAWSFKQSNSGIFLSLMLFLVIYNRRAALGMGVLMGLLCGLVLWAGGPEYRASTLFRLPVPGFSLGLGIKNFLLYLAECAFAVPGCLAMAAVGLSPSLRRQVQSSKFYQLSFITALTTSVYGAVSGSKIGASENYLIPAGILVTLFLFLCFWKLQDHWTRKYLYRALYVSFILNAAFILIVLMGIKGKVSKRYEHQEMLELTKCSSALPQPIFSQNPYFNLPWMIHGDSFYLSPLYVIENDREKRYEQGGIEGLIKEGFFASLILERAKMNELFRPSLKARESLKYYIEQNSSCPSTYVVFVKKQ